MTDNKRQSTPAASGAHNKEDGSCESTAIQKPVTEASAEPVSPAISHATANGREKPTTESNASKSCNQSGSERTHKPNCYECVYRSGVVGSAHSSCRHPSFGNLHDDPLVKIMAIFASVGRVPAIGVETEECQVTASPHGVRNGWFNHPLNFDPVWLETCTGFKAEP